MTVIFHGVTSCTESADEQTFQETFPLSDSSQYYVFYLQEFQFYQLSKQVDG